MRLKSRIKARAVAPVAFYDPERDGVTFSLLTAFKGCREKAKNVLEGWTSTRTSMAMTFGNFTHEFLRRTYEDVRMGKLKTMPSEEYIFDRLAELEQLWRREHPRADTEDLEHLELTLLILRAMMPLYFRHWKNDIVAYKWEKLESEFKLPVTPSRFVNRHGRVMHPAASAGLTYRRGKMDGSYRVGAKNRVRLFETKTKSRIDDDTTGNILPFELQVNIYMGALSFLDKEHPTGALYNIIRRPGLRQKKAESLVQFAARIAEDVASRPDWYFIRLQMSVAKQEIEQSLIEQEGLMRDFLDWWYGRAPHYRNSDNCENKYGVCPFLKKCATGDTTGLYKRERVFMELEEM